MPEIQETRQLAAKLLVDFLEYPTTQQPIGTLTQAAMLAVEAIAQYTRQAIAEEAHLSQKEKPGA